MDSRTFSDLSRLYGAVYSEEIREEVEELNDKFDPFHVIDSLDEEVLNQIMEELVYEVLDEGLAIEDLEDILDDVIDEARVTMGGSTSSGGAKVTMGAGSRMAAASRLAASKAAKRDARVQQIKGAVKSGIEAVKSAPGKAKEAAKSAVKDFKQQSHVGLAKYASSRGLMPGAGLKTQSSKGRSELRSAVASDVASRAAGKVKRAGEKVASAVQSQGERARASALASSEKAAARGAAIKGAASAAKAGIKKGIRGAALGLARRMKEDMDPMDVYSVVLEHLLDEGYASTEKSAKVIMANMSESWIDNILEASMTPADIERIAQQAAGKKKSPSSKLKSGMKE
jgi:hypothetical protein